MNKITTLPDVEKYDNAEIIKTVLSRYYRFLAGNIDASMGVFRSYVYHRFSFWLKEHFPAHYGVFGDAREFISFSIFHWETYAAAHRLTADHYRDAAEISTDRRTGERIFSDTWAGMNIWTMVDSHETIWLVHEFRPFVWDSDLRLHLVKEQTRPTAEPRRSSGQTQWSVN